MESEKRVQNLNVVAIVLNWNSAGHTLECVASLRASNDPRLSVIVVDNGSTDSSWEELQRIAAEVTLIQSGANLGYAGGNNVGIRAALDSSADYIWILNNDTVVDPLCPNELLNAAEKYPEAGIFVPKVLFKDRPDVVLYEGGDYDWVRAQTHHRGFGARDGGHFDSPDEVTFATGTSLFTRREVFERIGLLDERFFLYWEDMEFSHRALQAGYKLRYVPTARVWHELLASSEKHEGRSVVYDYYTLRNRLWFIREVHRGRTKVTAYVWTIPLLLRRLARIVVLRESSWIQTLKALARGLHDGIRGNPQGAVKQSL